MIIAGTGHRPDKLGGYGSDVTFKLHSLAFNWIEDNKPSRIITGMALGWDQALGWAAYDSEIPFTAAMPFVDMEKKWPTQSQEWFKDLLALSDDPVYVEDGGYASWKMQSRNEFMVDNCDVVLALWNGTPGGTANCIAYAEKVGKPIINLWEHYDQMADS
jgi:uncharacterized phage-like protein YoqJ